MPPQDFVQDFLADPTNSDKSKDNVRALMASHLLTGGKLLQQGLLQEAIAEYSQEYDRPIESDVDAEIVQTSYCYAGVAYKKLGDIDNAISALQKARELKKRFRVGTSPHCDLAEIYIEQGRPDEAIEVCQELLAHVPDKKAKQLLAQAIAMKSGKSALSSSETE